MKTEEAKRPQPKKTNGRASALKSERQPLKTASTAVTRRSSEDALLVQRQNSDLLARGVHDLATTDVRKKIDRLIRRGTRFYKTDARKAFKVFREALRLDQTVQPALEGTAWSAFVLGKHQLAQTLLRRIPRTLPSEPFTPPLDLEMEMVPIEGGSFTMGADPEEMELARQAELETMPRLPDTMGKTPGDIDRIQRMLQPHQVGLSSFAMSRTCVCNADLAQAQPIGLYEDRIPDLDSPLDPAICSYELAEDFCLWLSWDKGIGLFRLPTEAEWEYVARGWPSVKEPAGRFSIPDVDPARPAFPDMRGMVNQWCLDYYSDDYYEQSPKRDPMGPETGTKRAVRGGTFACWDDNTCLLPWNRSESDASIFELEEDDGVLCTNITGFRVVCVTLAPPQFLESIDA
jgi:formylglycine-generating enzyme required for sulfatase activity